MILLTGGSGFLGSWILRALGEQGEPVVALVRPESDCWRLDGLESIKIIREEPEEWPETIVRLKPRVVIASDWEGVGGTSRADRQMQFGNVSRISGLGEAAKKSRAEVFVAFGSQAEIGPHSHPVDEMEDDNPASVYGEAKVQLRKDLLALFAHSDTRFVWGRVFSIYGPMDIGSGMLPTLIRTLMENKEFKATKGDQTWSYLYASDFASAVIRMIDGSQYESIVNIGNPIGVHIREAINTVADYMTRSELVHLGALESDPNQSQYLLPITTQLKEDKWQPQVSLPDGIRNTVDWFLGIETAMNSQKLPSDREQ
jgi:nucleoside-diphosphate-sugar epimerase